MHRHTAEKGFEETAWILVPGPIRKRGKNRAATLTHALAWKETPDLEGVRCPNRWGNAPRGGREAIERIPFVRLPVRGDVMPLTP